ncbi:reverse transcriptase domain-containing protein [uncultured Phocaeicola sp.]|uniref:reverse transcriptase domain-containing protein n=1 Tax=uncultured Phocaeicola sp. TaxID=990718 RepID=UPI002610A64D|nr:reverse transcriptase domain-containing protein [uncultured Phocaeicola sp.]
MKPTIEILERMKENSEKNKEEVFTRLYRYLLRPDLYFIAYQKLYSNNGAATEGIDRDTADGFSEAKVEKLIASLADESYCPKPSRRIYLKKPNGKRRPLGIPSFSDKLVQEVLRMVLEAVYEPIFSETSHGFRPGKSCHTALCYARYNLNGTRWFIEGDIRGCFDNINHEVLIRCIQKKIKDARLMKLIHKFLKAGYLEDFVYHNTYSGCPQGGIISPILANIYLHELDLYVTELSKGFQKPYKSRITAEYSRLSGRMTRVKQKIKKAEEAGNMAEKERLLKELKKLRSQLLKTPCKSQTDKEIKYVRYADDFIIGVRGSREDCEEIKRKLSCFIRDSLKMELSEEKTLITHSNTYARFLGYDMRIRRSNVIKPNGRGTTQRTMSNHMELAVPLGDKIQPFLFKHGVVKQKENGELEPVHRNDLLRLTDLEIVSAYDAELRGICNFYYLAGNFYKLHYMSYLMEYSCLKTLAFKHRCTIGKIKEKFSDKKGGWCIPYETKKGMKYLYLSKHSDCAKGKEASDTIPGMTMIHKHTRSTLESRLKAKTCELCGCTESRQFEIHHVNKLKNLKGKEPWEVMMIAKRRKTMVVCYECHKKIHNQSFEIEQ